MRKFEYIGDNNSVSWKDVIFLKNVPVEVDANFASVLEKNGHFREVFDESKPLMDNKPNTLTKETDSESDSDDLDEDDNQDKAEEKPKRQYNKKSK